MLDAPSATSAELDEEIRDFGRRFARLIVARGFRDSGAVVEGDALRGGGGDINCKPTLGAKGVVPIALDASVTEAEMSLRASQRLAAQLQVDADALRFRVLPSLRENARQLQALFVAIDRVSDEVVPEIEASVARMEKAMYQMEEMRKEQVETRSPHGSYGLGSPWGAGLWAPRNGESHVVLPEVFETDKVFRTEDGGLAPL